mmetsp:Transcript_93615/g.267877  ORF Transcript_93615/g.267877 Transcript_93615/m.267877 type:complete len:322 (-) Transcript_93615:226-1191(-)
MTPLPPPFVPPPPSCPRTRADSAYDACAATAVSRLILLQKFDLRLVDGPATLLKKFEREREKKRTKREKRDKGVKVGYSGASQTSQVNRTGGAVVQQYSTPPSALGPRPSALGPPNSARTLRMAATASCASMPPSIRATATSTGARPRPATQCTAMHPLEAFMDLTTANQLVMTSGGGDRPSSNGISCMAMPDLLTSSAEYEGSHTRTISVTPAFFSSLKYVGRLTSVGRSMIRKRMSLYATWDGFEASAMLEVSTPPFDAMANAVADAQPNSPAVRCPLLAARCPAARCSLLTSPAAADLARANDVTPTGITPCSSRDSA